MKFVKLQIIFIVLLAVLSPEPIMAKSFDFADWGVLLKKYVNHEILNGTPLNTIDYEELGSDPVFANLLSDLKLFIPSQLKTHEEKLAFWINVYNVFAVKIVTKHYPLKSIKDIGSLFNPVWKHKVGAIDGKKYSLDKIEHQILRKMGEPRVHVAIVCASISCPDLAMDVFRPEKLNEQLDSQVRNFLFNPRKGMKLDADNKTVYLSSIFDWFKEDFESYGGVLKFIEPYIKQKDRQILNSSSLRVLYLKYNWQLNDSSL